MTASRILMKEYLSGRMEERRKHLLLSQEAMAEALRITPRAYGDLERGKYCASAFVLLLFLCRMDDTDVLSLIWDARRTVFHLDDENNEYE